MKTLLFLIIAIFQFVSNPLISQITTGSITMSIVDIKTTELEATDEMMGISELLKNTDMTIYFNPSATVTELNMIGTMETKIFFKNDRITQYIDQMGQKIKMSTSTSPDSDAELNAKEKYQIKYHENDDKEILGYQCYKAIILTQMNRPSSENNIEDQTVDIELVWYITEEIKMNHFGIYRMPGLKVNGTPLRMDINMGTLTLTYEATSVSKKVDSSKFEKPLGDYKEISSEELEKMGLPTSGKN